MKKDFFFVLDQGTTSHKLAVFDHEGKIVDLFENPAPAVTPHGDGLGHDVLELTAVSDALIAAAIAKYADRLFAFGFANQGETIVAWDRKTGRPLSRAVSWQCQDAQSVLDEKRERFDFIRRTSGLVPSPYFSAAKLEKLLRSNAEVARAATSGCLALGTLDAWMISHWSGGQAFITDPTTACRTQLYDTFRGGWSDGLLDIFKLKREFLPEVRPNHQFEVVCDSGPFASRPLPLVASLCDQPAALIGHGGLGTPCLKITLGTGAFVDLTWRGALPPSRGLLASILHEGSAGTDYYLEGGVLSFASAIDDVCGRYAVTLDDARSFLHEDRGIRILPALAGLGAPHFRSDVRTAIEGASSPRDGGPILAATLKGLVFRVREVIDEMAEVGVLPDVLRIDGGLSQVGFLMRLLADVTGKTVIANDHPHVTAEGVALTALDLIGKGMKIPETGGRTYHPERTLESEYEEWREFVTRVLRAGG